MIRETKFRGKQVKNNEWVFGAGVVIVDFEYAAIPLTKGVTHDSYGITLCKVHPNTIGQYIGLLDKNGVEIYEGDILKYHSGGGTLRKVLYKQAAFHSVTLDEVEGSPHHMLYFVSLAPNGTSEIEVSGNIYDNADTLLTNQP